MTNANSNEAIIPGSNNGKVTLQKVQKEFSPKSIEASSKLLSKPSILDIKISIQKGVQKRMWEIVTGIKPNFNPILVHITIKATAIIISGIINGKDVLIANFKYYFLISSK